MASVSPSPNSPPFSNPASPPPSQSPPSTAPPPSSPPPRPPPTSPTPASSPPPATTPPPPPTSPPPATSPPPTTTPPPSRPPISSPPPATVPPPSSPPISSPPPTNSPPPSSPIPPTSSPPPSSPVPPTNSPPPSSPVLPTNSPPPAPPPSTRSPPPPPSSPAPPSRPPPPPPSSPPPPAELPSPPPSNPPTSSPPLPSSSPPPSVPPRNPPSTPPPPVSSPPPTRTQSPPPPPTNTSTSPPIAATPPPSRRPPPPPSDILIPPPNNQNNNDTSPNTPSSNGGIGTAGIVAIAAVLGVALLAVIITGLWCLIKHKKKEKIAGHNGFYDTPTSFGTSPKSESGLLKIQASTVEIGNQSGNDFVYSPVEPGGFGNSRSKFTYEDLIEATNGFSPMNLLGSGGFGSVYKGMLADGTEVAVKELKIGGGQGEREFSSEVEIISRIHHRHLVSLVGYCISENKRLLVYEYVPNNTLYFHLHELVLDWPTRVKVASGAARGIAYLHEDCHPRVIHRDIKSSNILLDKNFEARVSDFGLAKLAADMYTHITTRVMGTFGYMAPEYASSGKLTEKSDVFSFGVVLLELITGRKPVDTSQPLGDESLVEWARPLLSHALETEDFKPLVDPRLGMNFVPNEMFRMIEAAAACVRHLATKRPRMGQIARAFDSLETEDLSNGMRVGESQLYNSAQQDAEIRLFRRMAFGSQNYSTDFFTQTSWPPISNER
ncbi:putative protein kinase RLK-Pelle-PERK-1 family [Helianthus annuus]|nr:putative protein kinase RLK-Pelle-PERK-1 family [Helianthus annuus]KAJ0815633.1 putative protein kinase RLK-Pelle-PERK-1 family [Helianthus annuus]